MDARHLRQLHFQQRILTLIRTLESKKETYNELKRRFDVLDKEFADTIMNMSILKLQIRDLETEFEDLCSKKCFFFSFTDNGASAYRKRQVTI